MSSLRVALPPAVLLALLLAAPVALGHAAPIKRPYEERLIHDCIDDYFGGDQPNSNVQGHDVMALDLREAYDVALDAHVLVFRLLINDDAHSGSELKDEISFNAKSSAKKYSFTTSNNQAFGGTFEKVAGPFSLNDGQRFAVEGTIKVGTLGLKVGDKVSSFKVESFAGGNRGDYMPGLYDTSLGPAQAGPSGCAPGCETSPTGCGNTRRPDYTIEGPIQYASWTVEPTKITVPPNTPRLINIHITNELHEEAQTITLEAIADDGVVAKFHDIASNEYENPYEFALDKDVEDHLVHLQLVAEDAGAKGTVLVNLRTNLGGYLSEEIEFTVGAGGATADNSTTGGTDKSEPAGGLPAPGLPLALLAIAATVLVGRRRR